MSYKSFDFRGKKQDESPCSLSGEVSGREVGDNMVSDLLPDLFLNFAQGATIDFLSLAAVDVFIQN